MVIGEKIREVRKDHKMTQKQLAEAADVAIGTIQQYELGKRAPRLEILVKIADALGVEIGDLLPSSGVEYELDNDPPPRLQRQFALEEAFHKLNEEGQQKAVERVQELTEIQRYLAKKAEISDSFGSLLSEHPEVRENFISALASIPDEGFPLVVDYIVSAMRNPQAYLNKSESERDADMQRIAAEINAVLDNDKQE